MIAITLLLISWDVLLAADSRKGNTISEIVGNASRRWWIMAYGWGVVGGHLFVPAVWDEPRWLAFGALAVAGAAALALGFLRVPFHRWAALLLGGLHGWLLWGQ